MCKDEVSEMAPVGDQDLFEEYVLFRIRHSAFPGTRNQPPPYLCEVLAALNIIHDIRYIGQVSRVETRHIQQGEDV